MPNLRWGKSSHTPLLEDRTFRERHENANPREKNYCAHGKISLVFFADVTNNECSNNLDRF